MRVGHSDFRRTIPIFLTVFLPVAFLVAGLGVSYIYEQRKVVLEHYQVEARHHVEGQINRVRRFYKHGAAELLAFSRAAPIRLALKDDANARREIADMFSELMHISESYDQIRLLDAAGQEVVRVERREGGVYVVPASLLQNKRHRDYVRQSLVSPAGKIYISSFDLNMEHGKVQRPYKSTIRFATPAVDDNGVKIGVLVINLLGISVMQRELSETVLEGEHLLINAGSLYWFDRHVDGLRVLEDNDAIVRTHGLHDVWKRISHKETGQMMTTEGLLTFKSLDSVMPDAVPAIVQPSWRIISFVPGEVLAALAAGYASPTLITCAVLILLFGFVVWLWSQRHTAKVIADKAHWLSEACLKLAEQDMDMGYWDWDMRTDTVTWSDGFNRIFSFNGTDVTPSFDTVASRMHSEDVEHLRAAIVEAIHSDARQEMEFRIIRDGKERWVHAGGQVVSTEGKRPVRMFGTIHNITERKRIEDERELLLRKNRQLAQGLIKAREDERSMLARALHDDIGQRLAAIQMHVSVITDQCASRDYDAANSGLRIIRDLAGGLVESVRSQLKHLRPPQLDELGLKAALVSLCGEWQERSGVDCHLRVSKAVDALGDDMCLNLYRIVQEALTNVNRHAGASEAHVNLRINEDIHLTIRDDGCGFDPDTQTDGIGLAGMRERMDLLDGSMRIESAPGKGTRLVFRSPQPSSAIK